MSSSKASGLGPMVLDTDFFSSSLQTVNIFNNYNKASHFDPFPQCLQNVSEVLYLVVTNWEAQASLQLRKQLTSAAGFTADTRTSSPEKGKLSHT